MEISKNLLETLREPIVKKMAMEDNASSSVSIQNLSNLMFYYSAIANVTEKRQFIYDIENTAADKLILKEKFNT